MGKQRKRKSQKARRDAELVQHITMLARTGASLHESASALGMTDKELGDLFKKRPKVLKAWKQSRLNLVLGVRAALAKSAADGKLAAIEKLLEELLQSEVGQQPAPAIDFEHLKTSELSLALGRQRQTLDRWRTEHGLRRGSDKTYSLPGFFVWFENFCRTKYSGASASGESGDLLRDARAAQIGMQIQKTKGQLLDRERVITGQICWVQSLVTFCNRGCVELSRLCQNQPKMKVEEILRGWFRELHLYTSTVPEHLKISASMKRELESFLERLGPQDYDKGEKKDSRKIRPSASRRSKK